MREQFTFYRSYWEAVKRLRKASDRLSALEAIAAYALDGEERDLTDAADAIFVLIRPLLDSAARKSQGGKKSVSSSEDSGKMSVSLEEDDGNNKKDKKKNNIKNKNKCSYVSDARARFAPPTLDEVTDYVRERNSPVDPVKFWQYFEEGGWKDSKGQPVRNWKQKLLTWEKYDSGKAEPRMSFADVWRGMSDD